MSAVALSGPSARAQEYDCGTYGAGEYGAGECEDEATPPSVTETPTDPQDIPVTDTDTDTNEPQPNGRTDNEPQANPGAEQNTGTTTTSETPVDNSLLLWLGLGILALISLIIGIWLIMRRMKSGA